MSPDVPNFANRGCFVSFFTHSVKLCSFTSCSFNLLFLKPLLPQSASIHCQSNEAQVSKEACASLAFYIRTQKFLRYVQKAFWEHNWRMPITRRARTARIGVSQPSRRVQRISGLLLFTGVRALWIGHEVENFQGEHRFRHKTTSNT